MALVPTIIRASSMTLNICLMPSCTPPTRVPTAGRPLLTAPNVSSQVVDAFRPILCSTVVTKTPLRSPSVPSSATRYLGTRNIDSPLVPGPWPSGRASTRWKMLSARSCSALVMNRLTPSMCQVPSGCSMALVRPAPTSEPASGSVSTMVAPHSRSMASVGEPLLVIRAEVPQHAGHRVPARVHPDGRVGAEDQLGHGPVQGPGRLGPAQLRGQRQPVPLGVHEGAVGLAQRLGNPHRAGGRVEHRRVPVRVGEGLGQRAGRHPLELAEDAADGLLVEFGVGGLARADPGAAAPRRG